MLVQDRERVRYTDDYSDYEYNNRNDRYACYDFDSRYEADRMRTSDYDRDSLMSSLERPASRSRLERSDADRYGFYRSNFKVAENNYDRLWDSRHAVAETGVRTAAVKPRKKKAMVIAYLSLALVAVLAVTFSVVGLGKKSEVKSAELVANPISASAEETVESETPVAETPIEPQLVAAAPSGEKFIVLESGEKVAVEVPKRTVQTKEEEKGFDKFCSWLNGVFGG